MFNIELSLLSVGTKVSYNEIIMNREVAGDVTYQLIYIVEVVSVCE
jgi:hypothetical protein